MLYKFIVISLVCVLVAGLVITTRIASSIAEAPVNVSQQAR